MTARPLQLLPPTIHELTATRDAYLAPAHLKRWRKFAVRWWTFHSEVTSLELPGRQLVKSTAGFPEHMEREQLAPLLAEYGDAGVPRPTGYADVFHERFRSPVIRWSYNKLLARRFAGGWQQALQIGGARGQHYKYDLRSAYMWAGSLGLPRTSSYRFCTDPRRPGVYHLRLARVVEGAPYPFNRWTDVIASDDEIELYDLPVARVLGGVSYDGLTDPAPMLDAIRSVSTWKQAARIYWGRWALTDRVQCFTPRRGWELKSIFANIVWAHTIVSRVRARVWNDARDAVHVFVDSIITPHQLRTGPGIGDWKLEQVYPDGVNIRGPGQYGPLGGLLQKAAGIPRRLRAEWINRQALIETGRRMERADYEADEREGLQFDRARLRA